MSEFWILGAALAIIVIALVLGYLTTENRATGRRAAWPEHERRFATLHRR